MTNEDTQWSNQEIYRKIFLDIIRRMYENASNEATLMNVREAMAEQDVIRLQEILVELQLSPLYFLMLYLDGSIGPSEWPGVQLVNAQTGEPLSNDYGLELAAVRRESWDTPT